MLLGKYQLKKRLGKGAFGQVMLAEDKNHKTYAIKMITKKSFAGENQYLLEYLESQIKCLKQIDSPYVMKLYSTEEDKSFKYMVCEYCDGGDLITVQSKQPNKVFALQKATYILSFVIRGLFCLHNAGYIHRDIKAENILMKTENGSPVYKLGDFGFTKNIKDISFTILGTGAYMSPEIYKEDQYGFEIDMWAFGVLFYFMLNMQFPFKPHLTPKTKKKSQELMREASNFSYRKFVEKSRKKLTENCTPQIQDLFAKIFNPEPSQRINFHDIRYHPIFEQHFAQKQDSLSRVLYKSKFKQIKNKSPILQLKEHINPNANPNFSKLISNSQVFEKQNKMIQKYKSKVHFLKEVLVQIEKNADLPCAQLLCFKFNVLKYILMTLKKIQKAIEQKQRKTQSTDSGWTEFIKSKEFTQIKKDLQSEIIKSEFEMEKIYDNCQDNLRSISGVNKYFQSAFDKNSNEIQFQGNFKNSYRRSTVICYEYIVKRLKQQQGKGNLHNYHLALITMCHALNKIFQDNSDLKSIFQDFFKKKQKGLVDVDFLQLKAYMAQCSGVQLNAITKEIISKYFYKTA